MTTKASACHFPNCRSVFPQAARCGHPENFSKMCEIVHTSVAKHGIAVHHRRPLAPCRSPILDEPVRTPRSEASGRSADIYRAKGNHMPITNIVHPVLVLGIIVLSLTFILCCTHFIHFVSQKSDTPDDSNELHSRMNMKSLFEQAAITCTIVVLYGGSMILFFMLINWGVLR